MCTIYDSGPPTRIALSISALMVEMFESSTRPLARIRHQDAQVVEPVGRLPIVERPHRHVVLLAHRWDLLPPLDARPLRPVQCLGPVSRNSPKQIRNPKAANPKRFGHWDFVLGACFGFRISEFVLPSLEAGNLFTACSLAALPKERLAELLPDRWTHPRVAEPPATKDSLAEGSRS